MKASDIIRNILDLIDQIDNPEPSGTVELIIPAEENPAETSLTTPADANHFKQIFDLLSAEHEKMYSNSPAEVVAGIESVTTNAGGGWNGPKNPADIKSNSISMYPDFVAKRGEQCH